jgi:hypothetical protein
MLPNGAPDAEPSKVVATPGEAGTTVNDAVGAWSGVIAIAQGLSVLTGVPAVFVAKSTGVTELDPLLVTYAVVPSGLTDTYCGELPIRIGVPTEPDATVIGVSPSLDEFTTYAV